MTGDWLKLHRSILDSELFADDWLTRLWIWCLCRANYSNGRFRGEMIERGQFVTGRNSAAAELQVSPSKWYRGIERLQELGCITVSTNSNWTTITVCKYDTYQNATEEIEQKPDSERTSADATSGQVVIQRADTIEERNNSKKERREEGKKETPASPELPFSSPEFQDSWKDFVSMRSEIKRPLKPTAIKLSLTKLAAMGEANAIQSLKESTANQWQGLFEPKPQSRAGLGGNTQHDPRGNFAAREQFLQMMGGRQNENTS